MNKVVDLSADFNDVSTVFEQMIQPSVPQFLYLHSGVNCCFLLKPKGHQY